ncbi:hypothetical protein K437DRAFT_289760 [Tilletiaria anomala UBC 951]|uniref:Uncharacterized protein n=1 Tax=Tilletiaria anomala (strain ATCC 24038 / CBS 436.72 / UBC 951) TaxID=1037660 RepID=A0A066WG76_TILAU|nr:uncharacterized protein K437DRAFT_289760 [Tilletiaria anomala UBC 951]KDN52781.1 hypothetical protein K437DRAFT_289760 [Tilletiaria anomala UBC 951]
MAARQTKKGGGSGDGGGRRHAAPVSDPRFARVQTDPRFLQPKRQDLKVSLDERFSHLLSKNGKQQDGKTGEKAKGKARPKVDRFGRPLKGPGQKEDADAELRRIYKVEGEEESNADSDVGHSNHEEGSDESGASDGRVLDYARGEGLLESSSDEESDSEDEDDDSITDDSEAEDDGEVIIGTKNAIRKAQKAAASAPSFDEEEDGDEADSDDEAAISSGAEELLAGAEDELDPSAIALLDAEAERVTSGFAGSSKADGKKSKCGTKADGKSKAGEDVDEEAEDGIPRGGDTSRLAVVNLDWDHIRARDLFKVFSSVVNPLATAAARTGNSARGQGNTRKGEAIHMARGKCLRVRVYPSDFGRERMRKEDREGPPRDIFSSASGEGSSKKKSDKRKGRKGKGKGKAGESEDDDDELFQVDEGGEFDEEQLRKYQLERLRYYYAIADFDSPASARHVYNEIDGTEMEASANIFDLRFVPGDMSFPEYELDDPRHPDPETRDAGWRDEATASAEGIDSAAAAAYKGVDFKTDALRHSKVKLTWDADDPERAKMTRKSRNALLAGGSDIRDEDFKAYLASDHSDVDEDDQDDGEHDEQELGAEAKSGRDRLRALLNLDGSGEGSGFDSKQGRGKARSSAFDDPRRLRNCTGGAEEEGDMEITFTPGLSEAAARKAQKKSKGTCAEEDEETTLEKYLRKQKEKRQAKKEARLAKQSADPTVDDEGSAKIQETGADSLGFDDPFFASDNDVDFDEALAAEQKGKKMPQLMKNGKAYKKDSSKVASVDGVHGGASSPADLGALLDTEAAPESGVGHFDMKDILRAEKENSRGKKKQNRFEKRRAKKDVANADKDVREVALQEDFKLDAHDDRFKAIFEDHRFALDPSHKSFLKTKGMDEILRAKREAGKRKVGSVSDAPAERGQTASSAPSAQGGAGSDDLLYLARKLKKRSGEQNQGKDGASQKKQRRG